MISVREYATLHATLFATYDRATTDQQLEIWYEALKDLDLDALKAAVTRWIMESESAFPTPAALRRFAVESKDGRFPEVDEALIVLRDTIKRACPFYDPQRFMKLLPPAIRQAVLSLGGPTAIADWTVENRTAQHAQFRDAYRAIIARSETQRKLPAELRPRLAVPNAAVGRLADKFAIPYEPIALPPEDEPCKAET